MTKRIFILIFALFLQACEGIKPKYYFRYTYIKVRDIRGFTGCDIKNSGRIISREKNGKLNGKQVIYDSLGCLVCVRRYKNGKLHGMIELYYNGKLTSVGFSDHGKIGRIEYYNIDW